MTFLAHLESLRVIRSTGLTGRTGGTGKRVAEHVGQHWIFHEILIDADGQAS